MNELQQLKQIIANAPDGWTHVDSEGFYYKMGGHGYMWSNNKVWQYDDEFILTRSRADIERIIELLESKA